MKAKIILLLALALFIATKVTAQTKTVTISGIIKDKTLKTSIPYVNIVLKSSKNQTFIAGTVSNEEGRFTLSNINSGNYILEISFLGYKTKNQSLYVGTLSEFLDLSNIELEEDINTLNEVVVKASKTDEVSAKMDKKVFSVADNITQSGGSVLQSMQSLPGVTVQDGKVQLRGNDKVMVLIDGKQTALTGFGNQSGLDNIPASAIEKIEIINNPSAKFDANGNAGIINIIYKKNKQEGFNGKIGIASGYGSLWERKANLPTIRPQYRLHQKLILRFR